MTFRLHDSLPLELLTRIRNQRDILDKAKRAGTTIKADEVALQALIKKAGECLDQGLGVCHMRDQRIAQIVGNAIGSFDGNRYRLFACALCLITSTPYSRRLADIG